MSVFTSIFGIKSPSPLTKFKDLGAELLGMAESIDQILASFDYSGADPNLVLARVAALEGKVRFYSGTPAQRIALTPVADGSWFQETDAGRRLWRREGAAWQRISDDRTLGSARTGQILAQTAWTDLATVTATIRGGRPVAADGQSWAFNGASGADRAVSYRIVCDGAAISPSLAGTQPVPLAGGPRMFAGIWGESSPAPGQHTWKLQISASANNAVYSEASKLVVTELSAP